MGEKIIVNMEVEDEWYADNDGGLWRYREDGTIERRD